MIYAETEIKLKNGCTAVVRNARPEDAKQTIEYLRTVSGESPFLLREPDEVNFTVETASLPATVRWRHKVISAA